VNERLIRKSFSNARSNYIGSDVSRIICDRHNRTDTHFSFFENIAQSKSIVFWSMFSDIVRPIPISTYSFIIIIIIIALSDLSQFRTNFPYVGHSVRAKMGMSQGYVPTERNINAHHKTMPMILMLQLSKRPGTTAHAHFLCTFKQIAATP
jgi:hypothetical protein